MYKLYEVICGIKFPVAESRDLSLLEYLKARLGGNFVILKVGEDNAPINNKKS